MTQDTEEIPCSGQFVQFQHSLSLAKLAEALCKAQLAMKPAEKNAYNQFTKSNYANIDSVMEAALELPRNGIAILQVPVLHKGRLCCETKFIHTSGEWISGFYPVDPTKVDPQSVGAAYTYAKRYSLTGMAQIRAGDVDLDGNSAPVTKSALARPPQADFTPTNPGSSKELATKWQLEKLDRLAHIKWGSNAKQSLDKFLWALFADEVMVEGVVAKQLLSKGQMAAAFDKLEKR